MNAVMTLFAGRNEVQDWKYYFESYF